MSNRTERKAAKSLLRVRGLYTWGSSDFGQLGLGEDVKERIQPSNISDFENTTQIASSGSYSMVLKHSVDKSLLYTFGSIDAEVDDDKEDVEPCKWTPTLFELLSDYRIVQVACGPTHAFALTSHGKLFSWGSGPDGQLGLGDQITSQKLPREITEMDGIHIQSLATNAHHTALITKSGGLYTCGRGDYGQLGHGDFSPRYVPSRVHYFDDLSVSKVSCGFSHTAALTSSGEIYVWGSNQHHQLGYSDSLLPDPLQDLPLPTQASMGDLEISTGISASGADENPFQPADADKTSSDASKTSSELQRPRSDSIKPYPLTTSARTPRSQWPLHWSSPMKLAFFSDLNIRLRSVSCGYRHTCAVALNGLVFTFGTGEQGELGLGPTISVTSKPTLVESFITSNLSTTNVFNITGSNSGLTGSGTISPFNSSSHSSSFSLPISFAQLASGMSSSNGSTAISAITISKVFAGTEFSAFLSDCGELFVCGRPPFSPNMIDRSWLPKKYAGIPSEPYIHSMGFGSAHAIALVDSGDLWRNRSIGRVITFLRLYVHHLKLIESEITPVCETLVGKEIWESIINDQRALIELHEKLLLKLDAVMDVSTLQNYSVGALLFEFLSDPALLEAYTSYGASFPKAWERTLACMKSIPNLGSYLEICFARPLFQAIPALKSKHPEQILYFLELPTLHFGQLANVIEEACRFTPETLPDRTDLINAEALCRQTDTMIQGSVAGTPELMGLLRFVKKYPEKKQTILAPHRRFLLKASFARSALAEHFSYKIYLFNDLIILTNGQYVEHELSVGETFVQDVISSYKVGGTASRRGSGQGDRGGNSVDHSAAPASPSSSANRPSLILVAPLQSHRLYLRSKKKQQRLIQSIDNTILEWLSESPIHREQRSIIGIKMLTNHLEMVMPLISKSWKGLGPSNSPRPSLSTSTGSFSSITGISAVGGSFSSNGNSNGGSFSSVVPPSEPMTINSSLLTSMIPMLSEMVAKSCSAFEIDQVKRERTPVWGSLSASHLLSHLQQGGNTTSGLFNRHGLPMTVSSPIIHPFGASFISDPIVVFMEVPGALKEKKFSSFSKAFTSKKKRKKRAEFVFTNMGTEQSSFLSSKAVQDSQRRFRVAVRLSGDITIGEAKERLYKLAEKSPWAESLQLKQLNDYVLRIRGINYYLTAEQLELSASPIIQTILRSGLASPMIEMLALPKTGSPNPLNLPTLPNIKVKDQRILSQAMFLQKDPIPNIDGHLLLFDQISSLVGDIRPVLTPCAETANFRHLTAGLRVQLQQEKCQFDEWLFSTSPSIAAASLWPQYKGLEALPSKMPTKLTLQIHLPLSTGNEMERHTLHVPPDVTIEFIQYSIFRFLYKHEKHKTREKITKFVKRMLESDSTPSSPLLSLHINNNDSSSSSSQEEEVEYTDTKDMDHLNASPSKQPQTDIHKLQPGGGSKLDVRVNEGRPTTNTGQAGGQVASTAPSFPATGHHATGTNAANHQSSSASSSSVLRGTSQPVLVVSPSLPSIPDASSAAQVDGENDSFTTGMGTTRGISSKTGKRRSGPPSPSPIPGEPSDSKGPRSPKPTRQEKMALRASWKSEANGGHKNDLKDFNPQFNMGGSYDDSSSVLNPGNGNSSSPQLNLSGKYAPDDQIAGTKSGKGGVASTPALFSGSPPRRLPSPLQHSTTADIPTSPYASARDKVKSSAPPMSSSLSSLPETSPLQGTQNNDAHRPSSPTSSRKGNAAKPSGHMVPSDSVGTVSSQQQGSSAHNLSLQIGHGKKDKHHKDEKQKDHPHASSSTPQPTYPTSAGSGEGDESPRTMKRSGSTKAPKHAHSTPSASGAANASGHFHGANTPLIPGIEGPPKEEGVKEAHSSSAPVDANLKDSKEFNPHTQGMEGSSGFTDVEDEHAHATYPSGTGSYEEGDGRSLKLTKKEDERLRKLRKEMGKRQKKEIERQRKEAKKAAKETIKKAKKEGVRARKEEKKMQKHLHGGKGVEDFVLKVTGVNEFLLPGFTHNRPTLLCDYDYIRRAISQQAPIELRFVEKSSIRLPTKDDLPAPLLSLLPASILPSSTMPQASTQASSLKEYLTTLDMAIARYPPPPTHPNPHTEAIKRSLAGYNIAYPNGAMEDSITEDAMIANPSASSPSNLAISSPNTTSSSLGSPSTTAAPSSSTTVPVVTIIPPSSSTSIPSSPMGASSTIANPSGAAEHSSGHGAQSSTSTLGGSNTSTQSYMAAPISAATAASGERHTKKPASKDSLASSKEKIELHSAPKYSGSAMAHNSLAGSKYASSVPSSFPTASTTMNNLAKATNLELPNDADTVEIYLGSLVSGAHLTGSGIGEGKGVGSESGLSSSTSGPSNTGLERPFWALKDDHTAFRIRLLDAERVGMDQTTYRASMYVRATVTYGCSPFTYFQAMSPIVPFSNHPVFNEDLVWPFRICDLPKEAKLTLTIYMRMEYSNAKMKKLSSDVPLAWVNVLLFSEQGSLKSGIHGVRMWQAGDVDGVVGSGGGVGASFGGSGSGSGGGGGGGGSGSTVDEKSTFEHFTAPSENFSPSSPMLFVDVCSAYRGSSTTSASLSSGMGMMGSSVLGISSSGTTPFLSFFGSPYGSLNSNSSFSPYSSVGTSYSQNLVFAPNTLQNASTSYGNDPTLSLQSPSSSLHPPTGFRKRHRPHLHSPFSSSTKQQEKVSKSGASSPTTSDDNLSGDNKSTGESRGSMSMSDRGNSISIISTEKSEKSEKAEKSSVTFAALPASGNEVSRNSSTANANNSTVHFSSTTASTTTVSSPPSSGKASPPASIVAERAPSVSGSVSSAQAQHGYLPKVAAMPLRNVEDTITERDEKWLTEIALRDVLAEVSMEEGIMMLRYRKWLKLYRPEVLPKMLKYVDWSDREIAKSMHEEIKDWPPVSPFVALQLLDARYPDAVVREYAVNRCLGPMSDNDVYRILLQLLQALKYEPFHASPLALFLLRRGFWDSRRLGHFLFWQLKSEMRNGLYAERYSLMMDAFLRSCTDSMRAEFLSQNKVLSWLHQIALEIKSRRGSVASKTAKLKERISNEEWPERFNYPLDPRIECTGFQVDACRVLGSKTVPLLITFKTQEPLSEPLQLIYKIGDDLRQDALTLQMITLMDDLWKRDGLDLRLKPYACMALTPDCGIIEVVKNATTTSNINIELGGLRAVLNHTTLLKWLKKHNPTDKLLNKAIENFIYSCAGYSVITFVLGFADRHNDNIMLSKQGHLFHIDFGHFLGHYRKVLGKYVDKTDFVFIDQYEGVMGKENFERFQSICCRAYNVIRKYSSQFITLFTLMLPSGLPELQSENDILFIKDRLQLHLTDEQAEDYFKLKLAESRDNSTIQFNHAFHVVYQGILN